ncbi:ImmA/IrrE family metallo-endopeptidase [Nanoarchaeota archaeon]
MGKRLRNRRKKKHHAKANDKYWGISEPAFGQTLESIPGMKYFVDLFEKTPFEKLPSAEQMANIIAPAGPLSYSDLEEMARFFGYRIEYSEKDHNRKVINPGYACIFSSSDEKYRVIYLNPRTDPDRQRQILGHELGHPLLYTYCMAKDLKAFSYGKDCYDDEGDKTCWPAEHYLDKLSHNLIFPDSILSGLDLTEIDAKGAMEIAKEFGVPIETVVTRLHRFTNKNGLVILDYYGHVGGSRDKYHVSYQGLPVSHRVDLNQRSTKQGFKRWREGLNGERTKVEAEEILDITKSNGPFRIRTPCNYLSFHSTHRQYKSKTWYRGDIKNPRRILVSFPVNGGKAVPLSLD